MCLSVIKNDVVLVAKKNIVCWKFLTKTDDGFKTPYWDMKVKLGETYKSDLVKNIFNEINVGLHSFVIYEHAKYFSKNSHDRVVVKCIIPKGSNYYLGRYYEYNEYNDSYASDKLKYICEVDENGNDIIVKKTFVEKLKSILKLK